MNEQTGKTIASEIKEFVSDASEDAVKFQLATNLADFIEVFLTYVPKNDLIKLRENLFDEGKSLLLHTQMMLLIQQLLNSDSSNCVVDEMLPLINGVGKFLGLNMALNIDVNVPNIRVG